MYLSDELFQRAREDYFGCLIPELRSNEGNKHQKLYSSERQNSSSREYIYYFISYTT